jgi:threonine dehydratase
VSPSSSVSDLPTYDDIARAARQIAGIAHRTPVLTSRTIDDRTHAQVFFKCENLQRGGAFKFRGAYNAMSRLPEPQQRRGVVAFSSGNHAQAVALAGGLLDIPRVIVMPSDAAAVKLAATRDYGAEVVLYDRTIEDREAIGRSLAETRGLAVIPPYDHFDIVSGTGTVARELIEDAGPLDVILAPCGGGGLLSGTSLTANALAPDCQVIGVEPATGDDAARSFRTKTLQTVKDPETVADGARTPSLGTITFQLVLAHTSDMVVVDDPSILRAMFFLWERMKLVVEPTGALGAAALLEGMQSQTSSDGAKASRKLDLRGRRVGVILSGGNVDFAQVPAWREIANRSAEPE